MVYICEVDRYGERNIHGGMMSDSDDSVIWWYYAIDGQQHGPVDEGELRSLAQAGRLKPTDLLWTEHLGDQWIEAKTRPGLFDGPAETSAPAAAKGAEDWSAPPRPAADELSCTAPISPAWDRMKWILFTPFNIGKWCVLGFAVWLMRLGQTGSGAAQFADPSMFEISDEPIVALIVVVIAVLALVIGVALAWVAARGNFMLLHNIVCNSEEVAAPWRDYKEQANSLFLFRIALGVGTILALLLPVAMCLPGVILPSIQSETLVVTTPLILGLSIALLIIFGILAAFIGFMASTVVVPVMYMRKCRFMDAWSVVRPLYRENRGAFVIYAIFTGLLSMVAWSIYGAVGTLACCATVWLSCLPFVPQVVQLPIFTFFQAYALEYLAQFGSDFDVWAHEAEGYIDAPATDAALDTTE